jgi:hypothetical protein
MKIRLTLATFATMTVAVTVQAAPNLPPAVLITSPPNGSTSPVGITVSNITADATDRDGKVVRVEFYVDGAFWAADIDVPYSFDLCDLTSGAHTIMAQAIDDGGAVATHSISLNAATPPGALVLVPNGSSWKYLDDGSDQKTAWRDLSFDDSKWSSGVAEFGYGDAPGRPERTTIGFGPNPNAKHPTTYFRKVFNVSNPGFLSSLSLHVLRDDRAIVYLNGAEVFRDTTNAVVNFSTYTPPAAADDGTVYQTTSVPASLLVPGQNVIAVEVHQESGTSSDLSFDLMLWAQGGQQGPPVTAIPPQDQTVALNSTATFSVGVAGTPPFTYQWHLNCRNILDGTNSLLTIPDAGLNDIGNYSVTIRNAFGQVTTWDAALTVTGVPRPQLQFVRESSSMMLRWPRREVPYRLEALSKFESSSGPNEKDWLNSDSTLEFDGQQFITDIDPEENSRFFRVSSPSIRILRQPQGRSAPLGEKIDFNVAAEGAPPLAYQWRLNGSPLPGETNPVLSIVASRSSYGAYQVAVEDANDALLSGAAVLRPEGRQDVLSDSQKDRALYSEAVGTLHGVTLGATREPGEPDHGGLPGGRSVWLAWRAPFTGIVTFDTIGSGFDTLLAAYDQEGNPIASDDDGASNLCSRIRFNVVGETVYNIALDGLAGSSGFYVLSWAMLQTPAGIALPVITVQPQDRIVSSNEPTTFSVVATDSPNSPLTYQWYFNGEPVPKEFGGTEATLRVGGQPPGFPSQVGQFHVEVANSVFTVRSRFALLQYSTDPEWRFVPKLLVDSICGFTPAPRKQKVAPCCTGEVHPTSKTTTTKLLSASAGALTGSLMYGGTAPPAGSRAYWTWVTNGWDCQKLVSLSATVTVGGTHKSCTLVIIDSDTGLLVKAADKGLSPNITNINKAKAGKVYWVALGFDDPSAVGTLTYSFTGTCP